MVPRSSPSLLTGHSGPPSPDEQQQLVSALHARFEAHEIDFDEFEELKGAQMRRLAVDSRDTLRRGPVRGPGPCGDRT